MKKPRLWAGAFFFSISIIWGWSGGFCKVYLVLFVWVASVWDLTACFAVVF
jgi:hypothetical protein